MVCIIRPWFVIIILLYLFPVLWFAIMYVHLHNSKRNLNFCLQVVFPLIGLVAIGWLLIIIGFGIETNQESPSIHANEPLSYSWWMVILVMPFMLVMTVVQAAVDNNRLVMNIIGAIVSFFFLALYSLSYIIKLSWSTILNSRHMQTTFLSALFLTGLGVLLTYYGLRVDPIQVGITVDYVSLQFSGAIIAAISWVSWSNYGA